ncbi:rhodanese-like domain-containing protein [Microcella alkaliphila]|uniref:Rhodanese-like domain-containing protein n=1 Tax=Microcella alkaliphila TaxID=279828 RepID=A0A4Q7TNU7_9MICO|nr:rhodanese-like domain-containing protein [Microcella alkaliphila]RZT62504.1 rhodanese-like domain-containing protein [Microcella alkaliphila]
MRHLLAVLAATIGLALGLAACAPATGTIEVTTDTVLIDVRTPAEFATGHLDGAINIDVQAADFEDRVAQLDPTGDYVVYCRSGNRSEQAITRMESLGFTELVNGGSVASASASTGIAVVTP